MTDRVKELEYEVEALKRQVAEMGSLFNHARAAGLDDLIAGHGFQRYAGGSYRLDSDGIKFFNQKANNVLGLAGTDITQPSNGALYPGLYVLSTDTHDIFTSGVYGQLAGWIQLSGGALYQATMRMVAGGTQIDVGDALPDSAYAMIDLVSTADGGFSSITLKATGNDGSGVATPTITLDNQNGGAVTISTSRTLFSDNDFIRFPRTASATTVAQGDVRYATNTDKFIGNVDGTEQNFATENWVSTQDRLYDETFAFFMGGA